MRVRTDISGQNLIKLLKKKFEYEISRQTGSHIRVTSLKNGQHHITIPNHNPIKIGTLNGIISDIAEHFELSKSEIIAELFS